MSANPNPSRITNESWAFMERVLTLSTQMENSGIYANKSGFHNTRAGNSSGNYSVQGVRNQRGPSDKAAAYDVSFKNAHSGDYGTISAYSKFLYDAGLHSDPRMKGWYEFFGNTDWDTSVEGWCYAKAGASSSDSSHLWHIHLSELREMVHCWLNKDGCYSVLAGDTLSNWAGRMGFPAQYCGVNLLRDTWGAAVYLVQRQLSISADGEFGSDTDKAVRSFQSSKGLPVDGIVGPQTWAQLTTLGNVTIQTGGRSGMYVVEYAQNGQTHYVWTTGSEYQIIADGGRLEKCLALCGNTRVVVTPGEEFDFFAGAKKGSSSSPDSGGGGTDSAGDGSISDGDVSRIAVAVVDEEYRRLAPTK